MGWLYLFYLSAIINESVMINRKDDLNRFYELLRVLERKTGGPFYLSDSHPTSFPRRGVYFFMESGEFRADTSTGFRVVRVGTHGLTQGSKSTLAQRLFSTQGSY